jgi:hypothetical protein
MNPKKDKAIAMRVDGQGPKDIADALSVPLTSVHGWIKQERGKGVEFPPLGTQSANKAQAESVLTPSIVVPLRLHRLLSASAERSGSTPSELAQRLLENALLKGASSHG